MRRVDWRYLTAAVAVSLFVYSGIDTEPLQYRTAHWVHSLLDALGVHLPKTGYTFQVGGINAVIVKGCVVWPAIALFVGLILATPGPSLTRKLLAIAVSTAIMTAGNVLRLAFMFYMMSVWHVGFRVAHDIVGQLIGLLIIVLAGWVAFEIVPETEEKLRELLPV